MSRRLLPLLALLASCSLIGAGGGSAPIAPDGVTVATGSLADTAIVAVRCVVPSGVTCRWMATVAGSALAAPDSVEARYRFAAPAPGDSVQITGTARTLRRGLTSAPIGWSAWVRRSDVAPSIPDSVIVVEIIVPPVEP